MGVLVFISFNFPCRPKSFSYVAPRIQSFETNQILRSVEPLVSLALISSNNCYRGDTELECAFQIKSMTLS